MSITKVLLVLMVAVGAQAQTSNGVPTVFAGITATPAPSTTSQTYNFNPEQQLPHWNACKALVAGQVSGARCRIALIGDSTTAGVGGTTPSSTGYRSNGNYPTFLVKRLNARGIPAQQDSFFGDGNDPTADTRLTLIAGGAWSGAQGFGGPFLQTSAVGDGIQFIPGTPNIYDRIDVSYFATGASGSVTVNGGTPIAFTIGNTGGMAYQTITIPATSNPTIKILSTSTSTVYLQGVALWNSTRPSVEVWNGGIGGASTANWIGTTSYGALQGAVAMPHDLAIVNLLTNDVNNGGVTAATLAANLTTIANANTAISSDVVEVIPQPFSSSNYPLLASQFRPAIETFSTTSSVGLLDLSNRYNNNYTYLNAQGLMNSSLHPDQYLYQDIANFIGDSILNNSSQTTAEVVGTTYPLAANCTQFSIGAGYLLYYGSVRIPLTCAQSPIPGNPPAWVPRNTSIVETRYTDTVAVTAGQPVAGVTCTTASRTLSCGAPVTTTGTIGGIAIDSAAASTSSVGNTFHMITLGTAIGCFDASTTPAQGLFALPTAAGVLKATTTTQANLSSLLGYAGKIISTTDANGVAFINPNPTLCPGGMAAMNFPGSGMTGTLTNTTYSSASTTPGTVTAGQCQTTAPQVFTGVTSSGTSIPVGAVITRAIAPSTYPNGLIFSYATVTTAGSVNAFFCSINNVAGQTPPAGVWQFVAIN